MGDNEIEMTPDERAAARAFLQRSDVRLSTVHRVATALISGAGLMVLFPAIAHDSVMLVARGLVQSDFTVELVLLGISMLAVFMLPISALWLVIADLTRFYFHVNEFRIGEKETFTPRFTLTGIRLPADELSESSKVTLNEFRSSKFTLDLLVPSNEKSRAEIDRKMDLYGLVDHSHVDRSDVDRAQALLQIAGSQERSILAEVAKTEAGMARHMLRIQVALLRYVKALVALLVTAVAVYAAASVVEGQEISTSGEVWLACINLLWAPVAMFAVGSPVRWLVALLRSEGARLDDIADHVEFTLIDQMSIKFAGLAWTFSLAVLAISANSATVTSEGRWGAAIATLISLVMVFFVVRTIGVRRTIKRFFSLAK